MTCDRKIGPFDCCSVVQGDCLELMREIPPECVVVSDPPFNIGYHYDSYSDRLSESDYWNRIRETVRPPCVLIHYPEDVLRFALHIGGEAQKLVAWIYNANTPRQWRLVGWFGVTPDMEEGGQPYKNPTDRRVAALMAEGKEARLYDWWEVQQVKNVSDEKTAHPCQMPLIVMERITRITPNVTIVDPYSGSGTTLVAAKKLGRHFLGVEISGEYCQIARDRLAAIDAQPSLFEKPPEQLKLSPE